MVGQRSMDPSTAARTDVFISYARRDVVWLERLRVHLEPLVRRDRLQVWDDGRIEPGARWFDEVRGALERAKAAVLLVSPDYLASPFISHEELPPILTAARSVGLHVFWIPIRPSIVDKTELAGLQAAHPPDKPLAGLRGPAVDRALAAIARSIAEVFEPTPTATFVELEASRDAMVLFDGAQMTIGRAVGNDIVLADDEASRWHAVFERFGPYWYLRDLSSRNGTCVNGQRVDTERRLQSGDRISIGRSILVFRSDDPPAESSTTRVAAGSPDLLPVERSVLVALGRPLASGRGSPGPATDEQVAVEVGIEPAEVAEHIARLVEKLAVPAGPAQRTRLTEEAIRRGAVSAAALSDQVPAV